MEWNGEEMKICDEGEQEMEFHVKERKKGVNCENFLSPQSPENYRKNVQR